MTIIVDGFAQAGFLRALADHFDRWGLVPVNISTHAAGGWDLQLRTRDVHDASAGLVGWARSFGATEFAVRPLARQVQVNVEFVTTLGGCSVRVWGCVDALPEAMNLTERTTITRSQLAHFAEHGTVPQAGGDVRGSRG